MKRRPPKTHLLVVDESLTDPRTGQKFCLCGLAADNERHRLSGRSADEREHEARRMGERE